MADTSFDVIIIGGGPGGYVTAIRGAQLGLKVCVVEKQYLGGICLNWGCIPTKALLRSAEIYHGMKNAEDYGLTAKGVGFDIKKVIARSRGVSGQLSQGVVYLLKKNNVTVVDGEAKLAGPGKVDVSKDGKALPQLSAKHVIIATGARPRALPGLEHDGKLVWSYFEALDPDIMPKKLLVIGSGATAMTLVPAIADDVAHITMLQRSPTYVVSRPTRDVFANRLRRLLPEKVAYAIIRRKNIFRQGLVYRKTRTDPEKIKNLLIGGVRAGLGPDYDVDTHFTPTYNPWDQRLCLIPDGDLFKVIRSGRASVVTDIVDTFTETGIRLQSGEDLEADIIVTATGLNLKWPRAR